MMLSASAKDFHCAPKWQDMPPATQRLASGAPKVRSWARTDEKSVSRSNVIHFGGLKRNQQIMSYAYQVLRKYTWREERCEAHHYRWGQKLDRTCGTGHSVAEIVNKVLRFEANENETRVIHWGISIIHSASAHLPSNYQEPRIVQGSQLWMGSSWGFHSSRRHGH